MKDLAKAQRRKGDAVDVFWQDRASIVNRSVFGLNYRGAEVTEIEERGAMRIDASQNRCLGKPVTKAGRQKNLRQNDY